MEVRRRMTLLDQMSVMHSSSNLRDLLRVRDEEDRRQEQTLTLGCVLRREKQELAAASTLRSAPLRSSSGGDRSRNGEEKHEIAVAVSRTLLDIIREEEGAGAAAAAAVMAADVNISNGDTSSSSSNNSKIRWRSLKDHLGLRRANAAAASACASVSGSADLVISAPNNSPADETNPPSDQTEHREHRSPSPINGSSGAVPPENPAGDTTSTSTNAIPVGGGENGAAASTTTAGGGGGRVASPADPVRMDLASALAAERRWRPADAVPDAAEPVTPARMSLMTLLEESDRQPWFVTADGEAEVKGDGGGGGGDHVCCVCMVRQKGAAFIPCGHTFCRACSRELWVVRGDCPLCNAHILEVLDIF